MVMVMAVEADMGAEETVVEEVEEETVANASLSIFEAIHTALVTMYVYTSSSDELFSSLDRNCSRNAFNRWNQVSCSQELI
jgi:hypothetical protein